MRSLTEAQWDTYFELLEQLQELPAEQRQTALLALRAEGDPQCVLSFVALRLGLASELDRERTGERIRNFVLKERLGSGGMGVVYRAAQVFAEGIERDVVVKLIHPDLLFNNKREQALACFDQELKTLARLEHKYIARIYDGGIHQAPEQREEIPFLALEYIPGKPLTDYVAEQQLTTIEVLALFVRICDAIDYAHQRGIIHCDLKPANILIDSLGEPRIIDFGLAQTVDLKPPVKHLHYCAGTLAYMSPEQLAGKAGALTPACDIYTLGVLLYELLTGQHPYAGFVHKDMIAAVRMGTMPMSLRQRCPHLSDQLERICAKALAPTDRHPTAAALAQDLRSCIDVEEKR